MSAKELSESALLERSQRRTLQSELVRLNVAALEAPQATPRVVDFRQASDRLQHATGNWQDENPSPLSPEGYSLNHQQIYRRRRRAVTSFVKKTTISEAEAAILYRKPLAEWDNEELARGRPRNADGTFSGPTPAYISAEIHEEAMDRFTSVVRTGMRVATVDALKVIGDLVNNDDVDNRGKPVVPASTKADLAKFLIEHIVGKPTQKIESDVSVKLQGILGAVMVNPDDMGSYFPGHMPGVTMELAQVRDEDEVEIDG
jgi:hypothetical protein